MSLPGARPEVDVRVLDVDGQVVVMVRGQLDLATVGDLRACLERCADGSRPLVLDLAGVTFMDSTGINTLIWAYRRQGHGRDGVVVRNPSDAVRQVLALAGLNGVLTIEPPVPGARQPDG